MNYEWIIEIAGLILAIVAGFKGIVPLVNVIKDALNLSARGSQVALIIVIVLVTLATMVAQGQVSPEMVNSETAVGLFVTLLATSQAEYQRIKRLEAGTQEGI